MLHAARLLGPAWVTYRLRRWLELGLGLPEKRLPIGQWTDYSADNVCGCTAEQVAEGMRKRLPFQSDRVELQRLFQGESQEAVAVLVDDVENLRSGRVRFFSADRVDVGWPPAWHHNAVDGTDSPQKHFSRISTFGNGDIKNFWECGRFGFGLPLVRAWERGVAADAPELFWQAVEHFAEHNPPMCGVQYACGQETALRSMLLMIGWSVFADCAESTDQRLDKLWALLAASGKRIEADIDYALSQNNNHGVSEATGLLLIGLQLPEHPDSSHWVQQGHRLLKQQLSELVYPDGGFSQHSANYHRMMMQVVTFALVVTAHHDFDMPEVRDALSRATSFLASVVDRESGAVPRYGHDDGALVIAWSGCDYDDFRPVISDACAVLGVAREFSSGPWDEGAGWLGVQSAPSVSPGNCQLTMLNHGGLAVLREESTMACLRVPRPAHRTAHLDTLHVDLWWRGLNVALDAGTYGYNAAGVWSSMPLAQDAAHNTVGVAGTPQADQVGRFLFVPWPAARVVSSSANTVQAAWVGRMGKLRTWERTVHLLSSDACCVVDHVYGRDVIDCDLRWHLIDCPRQESESGFNSKLMTSKDDLSVVMAVRGAAATSVDWQHGASDSTRGWYAPRYGQLRPCHDVVLSARGERLNFVTLFAAGTASVRDHGDSWTLVTEQQEWTIAVEQS